MEELDFNTLYVKNSVPLVQAVDLAEGEEYFTKEGHCYLYKGEDNTGKQFEFVKQTPLICTELLPEINTEDTLKLFWVLAKNMS